MGAFQKRSMSYWTTTIVGWRQKPFLVREFVCWNMLWDLWAKIGPFSMHGHVHLDLWTALFVAADWVWQLQPVAHEFGCPSTQGAGTRERIQMFYIVPTSFELWKVLIFIRGVSSEICLIYPERCYLKRWTLLNLIFTSCFRLPGPIVCLWHPLLAAACPQDRRVDYNPLVWILGPQIPGPHRTHLGVILELWALNQATSFMVNSRNMVEPVCQGVHHRINMGLHADLSTTIRATHWTRMMINMGNVKCKPSFPRIFCQDLFFLADLSFTRLGTLHELEACQHTSCRVSERSGSTIRCMTTRRVKCKAKGCMGAALGFGRTWVGCWFRCEHFDSKSGYWYSLSVLSVDLHMYIYIYTVKICFFTPRCRSEWISFAVAVSSELQSVSIAFGRPYPEVAKDGGWTPTPLFKLLFFLTTSWKIR